MYVIINDVFCARLLIHLYNISEANSLTNIVTKCIYMKKIEAIIRKSKFKELKIALVRAGVENFTYSLVRNVGEATESRVYRGVEYEVSAVERIHLVLLADKDSDEIVKLIVDSGITGEAGDGRVFITELHDAFRLISKDGNDIRMKLL